MMDVNKTWSSQSELVDKLSYICAHLYNGTMHMASAYAISISTNNEGWCVLVGGHSGVHDLVVNSFHPLDG